MAYIGRDISNLSDRAVLDSITASATATYNLLLNSVAFVPSSAESLTVSLNGVIQKPQSSYTVSGSTIVFDSALTSSDSIDFIIAERAITLTTVGTGSVGTSQLADSAVTNAKITDGTIANAKLANSSITLNGSAVSLGGSASVGGGITMAQQWRLTTDFSVNDDSPTVIASNWETIDTDGGGSIGSSMSESSGIFTYPSTGIYNVTFVIQFVSPNTANGLRYSGGQIETTANNSSYGTAAASYSGVYYNPNGFVSTTMNFMHDVTDVSNDKIRFKGEHDNDGNVAATVKGNTTWNYTYVTFVRLGDT